MTSSYSTPGLRQTPQRNPQRNDRIPQAQRRRLRENRSRRSALHLLLLAGHQQRAVPSAVFTAAAMSGRRVRILHQLTQPADHPVNIYHPEGEYLKGLVLYVE